jgi:voltage-gated potassium channel
LEGNDAGRFILMFSMFTILVLTTVKLNQQPGFLRPAVVLTVLCAVFMTAGQFYPVKLVTITGWALLASFFGFVAVGLFRYMNQSGSIRAGQIYSSVSVYLILALIWFCLYQMVEIIRPESFLVAGLPIDNKIHHSTILYFSLTTLTTLGYGDVVPVNPIARLLSALEAMTGVFYLAVTVARLVASYKGLEQDRA